ncbi:hypothetical protein CBR_g22899 [Chara braunii]|uniref:DUF7906 domain-containing protein n=1 Tax=Chara braunii TaxID=69332 RepID=A0A388L357_CHABU|nr:hypothetical protein CBR_g22899 [Chara braunii]|eukprot:GBG76682.1 hypothetical protein CBR_g22899 [Chara braunii]
MTMAARSRCPIGPCQFQIHLCVCLILLGGMGKIALSGQVGGPGVDRNAHLNLFGDLNDPLRGAGLFEQEDLDDWIHVTPKLKVTDEDRVNYSQSGRIAHFLQLKKVKAVHLPVPVNFLFVGFNQDGSHGFKVDEWDIRHWFEHMDHVLQHTRVPDQRGDEKGTKEVQNDPADEEEDMPWEELKDIPPELEGQPLRGRSKVGEGERMSAFSFVHFNFSCHAIDVGPRVTEVFQTAIRALARREYPVHNRTGTAWEDVYQVDADAMVALMNSLVAQLNLEYAYNIFILNPKRFHHKYGYRVGFSSEELQLLVDEGGLVPRKLPKDWSQEPPAVALGSDSSSWRRSRSERPKDKFLWRLLDHKEVDDWAAKKQVTLQALRNEMMADQDNPAAIVGKKARQILNQNSDYSKDLAKHVGRRDSGLHADCLVDSWVSLERVAFMDLTAGPFFWGPMVKGEGVRGENSLPSMEKIFAVLSRYAPEEDRSTGELEKELQEMAEDRFRSLHVDYSGELSPAHDAEMLMAELDVYDLFAQRHCRGRLTMTKTCRNLQERVATMQDEIHRLDSAISDEQRRVILRAALERVRSWSVSAAMEDELWKKQHQEAPSLAQDIFLSHVGAVLSNAMRNVITPSTTQHPKHIHLHVSFHLYIVHPHGAVSKEHAFAIDDFKHEVMKLKTSRQDFRFFQHRLGVADDIALGVAFTSSMRKAAVPYITSHGHFWPVQRNYIDSLTLQHQLEKIGEDGISSVSSINWGYGQLNVPIFIFSLHAHPPILIDKELTAKSIGNMVLVVQSDEPTWGSHVQCNQESLHLNLRNPLKSAVAAVAEHLTGILPSHRSFSHAHGKAAEDWMWAVGAHALSATSVRGWRLSQFHVDAAWRNYIVVAMDQAVHRLNQGIRILSHEATSDETFAGLKKFHHLEWMMGQYSYFIDIWRGLVREMEMLRYDRAVNYLNQLKFVSEDFLARCEHLQELLHPVHCTRQRTLKVGIIPAVLGIIAAASMTVFLVLHRRKAKPKIN